MVGLTLAISEYSFSFSVWNTILFLESKNMNLFYSFAVGGDGKVYEGRGFNVIGAHAPGYNDKSIGICLIGDWQGKR